ncbi:MAG: glycosyltransferase family 2 protein [Hyphomicrobiaceae bacterium]|nr:glycosyltransferase family 2 protein [Hyphomicrobiaceae bacterium]
MKSRSSLSPAQRASVVLVAYNSAEVIGAAIASIDAGAEIIVVDNASSDGIAPIVERPGAKLISNAANLGYGAACNVGAAAASREFVLFMNPDARLCTGALAKLVDAAEAQQDVAALNPRILDNSGKTFQRRHSRLLDRATNRQLRRPLTRDGELEMLTGAALFCRKAHFDAVGGFDKNIFLYCEDDDLAVRFKRAGFKLGYVHDAVVIHAQGCSTPPSPSLERFRAYHFMRSIRYAREKHGLSFNRRYRQALATVNWLLAWATLNERRKRKYSGYMAALAGHRGDAMDKVGSPAE